MSLNLINTAESMALRLQTSTNETEIFVNNLMTDERSRTHETAQNKDQSELVEHDTNHDEGQDGTEGANATVNEYLRHTMHMCDEKMTLVMTFYDGYYHRNIATYPMIVHTG